MTEIDARELAVKRLKAKRGFRSLLFTAVGVIALTTLIWALSGQGYFWPVWVAIGFGIALVTSGWTAYGPAERPISEEEIEREMQR